MTAGGTQSFVFSFTPQSVFSSTDVQLNFTCTNAGPAPVISGLNTLLLAGLSTPSPDIVALAATFSGDGIVNIPGTNGTGAFAVATVNVGAGGQVTVSADTGGATLPVSLSVCQTTPATGACVASPASSVATTIDANATSTFAVFVQGAGIVAFDPAMNRIFVRFVSAGAIRGATSVAVQTQ